jgi:outer membrane protein TolC
LARAEAAVRNEEVEIHRLTGACLEGAELGLELIPQEPPAGQSVEICRQAVLELALSHRTEIHETIERLRQAQVRSQLSCNELRPTLNLVLESYLSGLEGSYGVGRSLEEQFSDGTPSYTAGLVFEAPFGNRAAKANHRRRELEARKLTHELRATLQDVAAEVDTALRNVQTAWIELCAKTQAVQATEAELRYLEGRWRALPGADRAASFLLTEMLDAQDRLMSAEADFASAQATYAMSLVELKRVTGQTLSVAAR